MEAAFSSGVVATSEVVSCAHACPTLTIPQVMAFDPDTSNLAELTGNRILARGAAPGREATCSESSATQLLLPAPSVRRAGVAAEGTRGSLRDALSSRPFWVPAGAASVDILIAGRDEGRGTFLSFMHRLF